MIAVPIRGGENGDRTIAHRNIVRELIRVGTWNGAAARYPRPASTAGLLDAVIAQASAGGPIDAARRL